MIVYSVHGWRHFLHQLTKFSETGWPRSACNFMFPPRSRRNAIHVYVHTRKWRHPCTLETTISRSTRFWYYNFLLSLFQFRRIEMATYLRISYWNNFYFVSTYHFVHASGIVFMYTGNLRVYHLHDLAIWKWFKNL
jgi:hypothetical protein